VAPRKAVRQGRRWATRGSEHGPGRNPGPFRLPGGRASRRPTCNSGRTTS